MYFDSKGRTVFSPETDLLQPLYKLLEQYEPSIGGSHLFEDLIENYEYLDSMLKEGEKLNGCIEANQERPRSSSSGNIGSEDEN
ncbi:hypothetical protein ACQKFG_15370 [Peribacillus sp. NPDC076916]|uniref:hypothetical protein n=1 Tax=Peribacillus sp. NPDC076916 TaxID=3390608 RepID=UPI003CFFF33A